MMTDTPVVRSGDWPTDAEHVVLAQKILAYPAKIFLELFDLCHVYTVVPPKTGDSEEKKKQKQESEGELR
jgi:hypothetical protein